MHLAGAKQTKKQKKKHNIQSDIVSNIHICHVTILCILSGKIIKKRTLLAQYLQSTTSALIYP